MARRPPPGLVPGPFGRDSGAGQSQLLPVSGLGPPDRSYKVIAVGSCFVGLSGIWEKSHCDPRLATANLSLGPLTGSHRAHQDKLLLA